VGDLEIDQDHQLAAGSNELAWQVVIERPALWWPHALGDQPLLDVVVEAFVAKESSDRRAFRTGLRQVRMDDFVLSVNSERLFLKGSNYGPTRLSLGAAEPSEIEHDVLLARRANLDLLRVQAHIGRAELYDAADRHGVLLWQDLPLRGGYARGVRKAATRTARAAVDLLAHHPSIAIWCGHDDAPIASRAVLDASVKRALERADGSRPALAHSPAAHPGDLAGLAAKIPRFVRFVSGLGAGAFPTEEDQAAEVRAQVEILRRLKYRPTGGFCQQLFADPRPVASASVLDHRRVPKLAYEALAAACASVIVVAEVTGGPFAAGAPVELDVHVVSDLRIPLDGVRVRAELAGPSAVTGQANWDWLGDIGPDSCARVGAVVFVAPPGPATLVLQLTLEHEAAKAARRYELRVGGK
jgi:beta-mannosidase